MGDESMIKGAKRKVSEGVANKVHQKRVDDFKKKIHTTPGIPRSSPTRVLVWLSLAYLWESGRDPEFSSGYGRM